MSYKPIRADALALFETLGWVQKDYMKALRVKPTSTCLESVLSIIKSRQDVSPKGFTWTAERFLGYEKERSGRIIESYNLFFQPRQSVDADFPAPATINTLLNEIDVPKSHRIEKIIQTYRCCYYNEKSELLSAAEMVISGLDEIYNFKALAAYVSDIKNLDPNRAQRLGPKSMADEISQAGKLMLKAFQSEASRYHPSEFVQRTHYTIKQTLRALAYLGEVSEQKSFRKFALKHVTEKRYNPSKNLYSELLA